MNKLPQISEAEYEIMKIIWEDSPVSTNQVCQKAGRTHSWSSKTIHTLLTRLRAKKAIDHDQRGRMYYYFPLISQDDYLDQENQSFLKRFYNGKVTPMVSAFLNDEQVSRQELEALSELIESRLKSGDKNC